MSNVSFSHGPITNLAFSLSYTVVIMCNLVKYFNDELEITYNRWKIEHVL